MKLEDIACLKKIETNSLGDITFIRYSLVLDELTHYEKVLSEFYDWVKAMGITGVENVSVSSLKKKSGILITGRFREQMMFNFFLTKEKNKKGFVKKVEVAGTKGLYVFNSESEEAFMSTCITPKGYEYIEVNPKNSEWIELINHELKSQEVI